MAACFHLRSVKVFSFLLVLPCFSYGFEFRIASGQPSDGYSYECSIFHPPPPPHGFKFLYGDPAKSRADNIFLRSEDQNCDYNGKNVNFAITNIIYENSSFIVLDIQLFIIFLKKNTFSKIVESVVFHLNVSKSTP